MKAAVVDTSILVTALYEFQFVLSVLEKILEGEFGRTMFSASLGGTITPFLIDWLSKKNGFFFGKNGFWGPLVQGTAEFLKECSVNILMLGVWEAELVHLIGATMYGRDLWRLVVGWPDSASTTTTDATTTDATTTENSETTVRKWDSTGHALISSMLAIVPLFLRYICLHVLQRDGLLFGRSADGGVLIQSLRAAAEVTFPLLIRCLRAAENKVFTSPLPDNGFTRSRLLYFMVEFLEPKMQNTARFFTNSFIASIRPRSTVRRPSEEQDLFTLALRFILAFEGACAGCVLGSARNLVNYWPYGAPLQVLAFLMLFVLDLGVLGLDGGYNALFGEAATLALIGGGGFVDSVLENNHYNTELREQVIRMQKLLDSNRSRKRRRFRNACAFSVACLTTMMGALYLGS